MFRLFHAPSPPRLVSLHDRLAADPGVRKALTEEGLS